MDERSGNHLDAPNNRPLHLRTCRLGCGLLHCEVFMYGYSHGGCITYRAVEQGAPVTSFAVIEGFSDINLVYLMTSAALLC